MTATAAPLSAIEVEDMRRRHGEVFASAKRRRTWQLIALLVCLAYGVFSIWAFDISFQRLFGGLERMWLVLRQMIVWKDFWSWDFAGIFEGMAQSLAMALLGTLIAATIAFPLSFVAACTVMRVAFFRHVVRRLFDLLRGVDPLIWALVYARALGLGPLPGTLAIATSDIGSLGKLFSKALENVDRKQIEGVTSTGASRLQTYRFGFLPQVSPVFLSQILYYVESNTRSATIMGVVGAGGIGLQLSERMKVQYWDQAAFIILLILVMVACIDWVSGLIRRRFIGKART